MAGMLVLSCREPYIDGQVVTQEDGPHLGVAVQFPKMSQTKADDDPLLPASYAENTIHSLAIWVFETAEPHKQVLYKRIPEEDFPPGGGIRRYSLPVEKDFAESAPNVDIFVLANAKSIGLESLLVRAGDLDSSNDPTYSELDEAAFGQVGSSDHFGLDIPVRTVPDEGLPMSGVRKNCPVVGEAPVLRVETVSLKRAVSRFRILFCKSSSLENNVQIKKVTFYGYQFPKKELVFTEDDWGIVYESEVIDSYVEFPFVLNSEVTPASSSAPEDFIYVDQQDPEAYETMLNDAVSEGHLTDYCATGEGVSPYFYFRESDQKLSGLIEYTVNGATRTKEFSMSAMGDFARNRTWTLLGIFVSGNNLQLSLRALPWDYNSFTLNLNDQAVHVTSRFKLDGETVQLIESTQTGFDWDAHLIAGTPAKGEVTILTPMGGFLEVKPEGDTWAFNVQVENNGLINPKYNSGRLYITVTPADVEEDLKGTSISLAFSVKVGDREIEAQKEVENDKYRFVQ